MRRVVTLIAFATVLGAAHAQNTLPPGRGPVPLVRPGEPLPPPDRVPFPTPTPDIRLEPPIPPGGAGDQPLFSPAPAPFRRDPLGGPPDLPDDAREPYRNPLEGGVDWPQRGNQLRDDEYSPRYRFWYFPDRQVRFQPTELSQARHELDIPIPIILEKSDLLGVSLRGRNIRTYTRAILPDSGRLYPKSLWELSLGVGYLHRFDNGWSAGILPRVGTISDKPFESTRELNVSLVAFVRAPAALQGDFWTVSLLYFPNSTLPFPIPGIAYEWNPDPTLQISAGIPLSVRWQFAPKWQFDFAYRPVTQINSRISYSIRPGFKLYSAFDWDPEGYYLAGRPDRRNLFFIQEKRLSGGVRLDATQRLTFDFSGGLAFDRNSGVGRSSIDYDYDRVDISRGGFVSAWLLLRF